MKAVIFDFDGTLFDSMDAWKDAGEQYIKSLGIDDDDIWVSFKNIGFDKLADYLNDKYGVKVTTEEIRTNTCKIVEDYYFNRAVPKDGVLTFLSCLKTNNVKMCVATASNRYLIEAALKRNNMLEYFDNIYTCDEIGVSKDKPDIYLAAVEGFGDGITVENVAVLEDSYLAATTAKKAGFFVVGIRDSHEQSAKELEELSDVYVNEFSNLAADFTDITRSGYWGAHIYKNS